MTDFPPPSGRPEAGKSRAFRRFRSVLFALGAIGLAAAVLAVSHRLPTREAPPVATAQSGAPGADLSLPKPDLPPPVRPGDLKGGEKGAAPGD